MVVTKGATDPAAATEHRWLDEVGVPVLPAGHEYVVVAIAGTSVVATLVQCALADDGLPLLFGGHVYVVSLRASTLPEVSHVGSDAVGDPVAPAGHE